MHSVKLTVEGPSADNAAEKHSLQKCAEGPRGGGFEASTCLSQTEEEKPVQVSASQEGHARRGARQVMLAVDQAAAVSAEGAGRSPVPGRRGVLMQNES